jgi:predicted site-specific integrase-resolvase
MKAKEVLELLDITQPTLGTYCKKGLIRYELSPTGKRIYNDDDVYAMLNKGNMRLNYIYARVSTPEQKNDLSRQVEILNNFCINNGIQVDDVFKDIASGISFDKRKEFFKLLDDVLNYKVAKVVITYKDRLSRVGFELFYHLFKKFGTEIVVASQVGSEKLDSEEIFEEIVSLLHCYSMKMYSKRRVAKIREALEDDQNDSESL